MTGASLELVAGGGDLGVLHHHGRSSGGGTLSKGGGPPGSPGGFMPFLFLLQIAFIVKYYHLGGHGRHSSACTVYRMRPETCPEEFGVAAFQAAALVFLFARVVRQVGQQQIVLAGQANPRLIFLVFALLCADITNSVLVNGFYFVQVPINFIGYLLLGCTATFEVQHAVQLHQSTLHFICRGLVSFSYYMVLLQVFAISFLALNIGDASDNGVAAFVQVLAEIAVVVECLMMPSMEPPCSAAGPVRDMVQHQNAGESINSNRRRGFLSIFLAVQFVANTVKFVLPSPGRGGGRCTVFNMGVSRCPTMFWCSCLQLCALMVVIVFTLQTVGQEMLQRLRSMNGRLVFLCFGMCAVNVVYMVLTKNYAYAPQIAVDPGCYMLFSILAIVEVRHWREDQPSIALFIWRLGLSALFYIVLLTLLIAMVHLSHDIKDAAVQSNGAYVAAFVHVMMEMVAAIECLLLSFI